MTEELDNLVDRLVRYNKAYRKGAPVVSDLEYDKQVKLLRFLDPYNSFLKAVEPEEFRGKRRVLHPTHMLSMEKAYDLSALKRFLIKIERHVDSANNIMLRVTAKLDGLAGRDDGKIFVSRGDGRFGYDISSAFTKGVIPVGGRGRGLGEIVVVKSYFEKQMTDYFEHPRNMVVGIVSSDSLNSNAKRALNDGKIHFVPYAVMESVLINGKELISRYKNLYDLLLKDIDYPVDGLVVEITDKIVRTSMGATAHHNRWQIAIKVKGETADALVNKISWQIGRSGNITPVAEISPVRVSGATIRRVTLHNAGHVRALKIGNGAIIKIIRSGEVIPKLESVLQPAVSIKIPSSCPVCGNELNWNGGFLKCFNYECRARVEQRLTHWFKTLGNAEGFGIKTIHKIVNKGYNSLKFIYGLSREDFMSLGFGKRQSENLSNAISQSLITPVEDWRFLAAFGIPGLGLGDSFRLLSSISIYDVVYVKKFFIASLYGFGCKTSHLIESGIIRIRDIIVDMLAMKFNLVLTLIKDKIPTVNNRFAGKLIAFTGKMEMGSRAQVKNMAIRMGFKVQSRVSKNTDYLICGPNGGGKSKLDNASAKGVSVLTEDQYRLLLNSNWLE